MIAKLALLAPVLLGIVMIFAEQIKAEIRERMEEWRVKQRKKRLERDRATSTKTD